MKVPPIAVAPFDATQARQHQDAWANHLGVPVEFTNSIGMKFRLLLLAALQSIGKLSKHFRSFTILVGCEIGDQLATLDPHGIILDRTFHRTLGNLCGRFRFGDLIAKRMRQLDGAVERTRFGSAVDRVLVESNSVLDQPQQQIVPTVGCVEDRGAAHIDLQVEQPFRDPKRPRSHGKTENATCPV